MPSRRTLQNAARAAEDPRGAETSDRSEDVASSVDAMRRILRELRVIARKSELAAGLSAAQVFVLTALASHDGMSVGDVAAATMTDRSSAAAVIDRLVQLGYAARSRSTEDRRRAEVSSTSLGRRALRRAAPPPTAILIDAIFALSEHDRRSLATGLTALTRAMGIADQPAGMLFEDAPRTNAARRRRSHGG